MRKITFLFVFLGFYCTFPSVFGQETLLFSPTDTVLFDWQEQILQQVDIEELGEEAYHELLEELSEMVLWSDTTKVSHLPHRFRHQLIAGSNRTLTARAGYLDATPERQQAGKAYLGDAWHHSIRYRVKSGSQWQAGLSLEKDAGEAWQEHLPGFDSWHAFLSYNDDLQQRHWLRQAVIGHYRLRMGCGLLVNQSFTLGKHYTSQLLNQRSNTFSPYASNAESGYMQGAAFRFNLGHGISLLPYVSALPIDGTLTQGILTAIKTDGLHRTISETKRRNAAWQSIFGTRIGLRGEWYDIGLHLMTTHLQYDYIRALNYYNENYFRGHQLTQFSTDYQLQAFDFNLRGELAFDDHGGMAMLNVLRHGLGRYWNASLIHRYYSKDYHQLHASSLRESAAMQGEQGLTASVEGSLSRHWDLQFLTDWFHFCQPQFGIRQPSSDGFESIVRAIYQHRTTTASLGYRMKSKGDYLRHSFDSYFTFSPTPHLSLRTQLKGRIYSETSATQTGTTTPSTGYAISQSGTWEGNVDSACHFTINAQATYFDTDDYDSRLYMSEKNILYGFGLPMLHGQGLRYSITGNLHLGPHLIFEGKWAMTNYANCATISSGLQQIKGNTQQDLWLQVRIKL